MPLSAIQRKKAQLVGPGSTVGDFLLKQPLGRGGMGIVYEAVDCRTRQRVAVKILAPHLCSDPNFSKRFLIEARATAALSHANVVKIHCAGRERESGLLFMAMELCEGQSLERCFRKMRFSFGEVINIVRQVARGLAQAASRNIVHRDVKPGNIILSPDGHVKLLDFGLAKCLDHTGVKLTRVGKTVGTPEYMSPEQACADTVDPRSDLYSLGVIMYQLLAGARPFQGETQVEEFYLHINRPPRSIRVTRPNVPATFEVVLQRLLARKPDERYPNGTALVAELDQLEWELKEQGLLHATPRGPAVSPLTVNDRPDYRRLCEVAQGPTPQASERPSPVLLACLVVGVVLTGAAFALSLGGFF